MEKYQCIKCHLEKDEDDFYKRNSGIRFLECKTCTVDRNERYRKRRVLKLREEIFCYYGGSCSCCGESNYKFLTIDHVNNDGSEHKKAIANGKKAPTVMFYKWIVKNNFPGNLRLLCWNCNCGRYFNGGICPHKEEM